MDNRLAPFDVALRRAAALAQRSPSSHNCQPWAVARLTAGAEREGTVAAPEAARLVLALDDERALRALPAHQDEMLLSCGMYWHLLRQGLAALGWQLSGQSCPPPADLALMPQRWRPLVEASFRRDVPDERCFDQLTELAAQRRTNRGDYLPVPVDRELALIARDGSDPLISFWSDQPSRDLVADMMARDGTRDFSHAAAWQETYSFLRGTESAAHRQGDGFSVGQLLGGNRRIPPQLVRAMLSPAAMRGLGRIGLHRLIAQRIAAGVSSAPAIVAVSTRSGADDLAGWLWCGAEILRCWLAATTAGIAFHPLSVLIQHNDLRARLEDRLNVAGRLVFLARAGRPAGAAGQSPRLPSAERLHTIERI